MIEICDADFYPLEDLSLKWRWTDERWNELPSKYLECINPIREPKAAEILQMHQPHLSVDNLDSDFFETHESISTDLTDFSIVKDWLKNRIGNDSENVFVSWDKETAVRTTGKIFCNYWNDFCYPVSDDISVSTANLNRLLIYHHDERFVFGKVKKEFIR